MCLAIPGKVINYNELTQVGEVDVMGVMRKISFDLVQSVKIGDYVLVHAGFAIEKIDEEEAKKTLEIFEELASHELC